MIPTRKEAWQLVCEYTESESLRRHMLSVESAMRAYASRFGDDADLWGVVGLQKRTREAHRFSRGIKRALDAGFLI